jgi:hypothetical protein
VLSDYLQKAMSVNADRLEIEYKDGQEWITAFRGNMGLGIGSVDSTERDKLFEDLKQLKKSKRITILGKEYRLSFTEHESFGETVYEVKWKRDDRPARTSR